MAGRAALCSRSCYWRKAINLGGLGGSAPKNQESTRKPDEPFLSFSFVFFGSILFFFLPVLAQKTRCFGFAARRKLFVVCP